MHKCDLTNEQLQEAIRNHQALLSTLQGESHRYVDQLASAIRELLDYRADAASEFRTMERSLAYSDASSFLETNCSWPAEGDDDWLDLESLGDGLDTYGHDAVRYLDARRLLDRHPDHPHWVQVRDEDEPRAEGPLDPCPEVA